MASLRLASGWTRKLRCQRCRWVWQAQLSDTDKLLVAADAMPPVRRTLAAIAQAAADAARTTLPRLRRATAVLADELEAGRSRADRTPTPPAGSPAEPVGTKPARATVTPPSQHISAGVARVIGAVRQQSWWRSWRLSWWRSWLRSWLRSWRLSWWRWRPSLSRLQCLILRLALTDAAIVAERTDVVWAMPQTASFYATLGLPVNLRGVHFARLAATAERHDGVPPLRFAIRNAAHQEIYSWTAAPARGRLSAGHKLTFRSELTLPPPDTRDVVVRFIDRENTL